MRVFSSFAIWIFSLAATTMPAHGQTLGKKFNVFEHDQRGDIVKELCDAMKKNYSLWTLKESRIHVSPDQICKEAIAREDTIPDPSSDSLSQAKSNLDFTDRMLQFTAAFQDSHLYIAPVVKRSWIRMPFQIAEIRGKVVVTSVETPLLKILSRSELITGIDLGDEIVAVNGENVQLAATDLLPWISDSSRRAAHADAVSALARRSFKFPDSPTLRLSIIKAAKKPTVPIINLGTSFADFHIPLKLFSLKPEKSLPKEFEVEIPWVYDQTNRADEREFFHQMEFHDPVGELTGTWNQKKGEWEKTPGWTHGYGPDSLVENLKKKQSTMGTDFLPSAISGVYEDGGRKIAVLQLRNFPPMVFGDSGFVPFSEQVGEMIEALQKEGLPLIVDLRHNYGGAADQAAGVARRLIPKGTIVASFVQAFPLTHLTRTLNELISKPAASSRDERLPNGWIPELSINALNDLIRLAASTKAPVTSAFVSEDLTGQGDPAALARGVAVLITPECVSACELLTGLLKRAGAAVLIGTETDGTGAGFISAGKLNGSWKDHSGLYEGMFPTFAFGTGGGIIGQRVYPDQTDALCSEQKPIKVSGPLEYESELQADIVEGDKGWMRKALDTLSAQSNR